MTQGQADEFTKIARQEAKGPNGTRTVCRGGEGMMRLAFASTLAILCGIGWVPSKGGGNDAGHQKEEMEKRKKDEDEKVRRERYRQLSSEKAVARPYALQRIWRGGERERGRGRVCQRNHSLPAACRGGGGSYIILQTKAPSWKSRKRRNCE
jgi:hypothetical protein